MNVIDAAHRTVHAYPGGSESLGPRIGISPAVLRSKVNPNNTTHRLALEEADEIMGLTQDYLILQALAANHGFGLHRLEAEQGSGNVLTTMLGLNVCEGEFARTLHDALADGVISDREMNQIADAGHQVQSTLIQLISMLRAARGAAVPVASRG